MTPDSLDSSTILSRAFGRVKPPERITQEAFDENQHLHRLARLRPGERAQAADLWSYTQDLRFTHIQGPLFAYLLPFCLDAWREDLRGAQEGYGGFVEHFYAVLADCDVFDQYLTPAQTGAVSSFMRRTILDEIDDARGLSFKGSQTQPYRWIKALTTYGVLLPDLNELWNQWWSLATTGRAIAAVQYLSCLMYRESENPVFAPWTREAGGGSPHLWGFAGHLYTHRWLEQNVVYLKRTLEASTTHFVLARATELLTREPEHAVASQVLSDFPGCEATLKARCSELPRMLETKGTGSSLTDWSS
jgi:hypothetical protein